MTELSDYWPDDYKDRSDDLSEAFEAGRATLVFKDGEVRYEPIVRSFNVGKLKKE